MELPNKIDVNVIPRFVIESKYEGIETDIKDWFISYYFWKRWNGKEEEINNQMLHARAIAEAKYEAIKQTNALKNSTERSALLQAYDAHKNGWYKYIGEVEDVKELLEEMLADAIENKRTGSQRYDIQFMLEQLFPALETMNIPQELIFAIPDNIAKARLMVPAARAILKNNDLEEAKENLITLLEDIPNPDVTWRGYEDKIATFMGKEKKELPCVPAEIFLLPDKELIVIESDRSHTLAIENTLKGIVEGFDFRDSVTLMKKLNSMLLPKESDHHRFKIKNNVLVQDGEGILLPSKEQFKQLAIQAVVANRHTIYQSLYLSNQVAICIFVIKLYGKDFINESAELFNLPVTDDLLERIRYAVSNYYELPNDVGSLHKAEVKVTYSMLKPSNEICLALVFTPIKGVEYE